MFLCVDDVETQELIMKPKTQVEEQSQSQSEKQIITG